MTKSSMGLTEWGMLVVLAVVWGGAFFFMKVAVAELPVFTVVFIRVGIASLTLLVFLIITGVELPKTLKLWQVFFVMGFMNNLVPFSLLVWGMTEIASGLASILNATTPIFTILVAHFMTSDERISLNKSVGVLLGLAGVAVLIGVDALAGLDASILAMMACLGAALSYGFAAAYGRRLKELSIKPAVGAFGQVTASTILLFPLSMLIDNPWTLEMPGQNTILSMLALGVVSTALAYILYFRILASAGATNAALVTLLVPVSAIFLGWMVLGEALSPNHFAGMGLIAVGLMAIDGRIWPKKILKNAKQH